MTTKNQFGGIWTRIKIDILSKYLRFYAIAMHNRFTIHYADAFAGTGKHSTKDDDKQLLLLPSEDFHGSVLAALNADPGFHRYYFNDLNKEFTEELKTICDEHLDKDINILNLDANQFVPMFCNILSSPNDRAVLFVDPFSTQLDWKTIATVAQTDKVDMWLLFPLSVILRMTPKDGARIDPTWRSTLNRLLGTNDWETALYSTAKSHQTTDMFDAQDNDVLTERINPEAVQEWVKHRLEEKFSFVSDPVMLKNNNRPMFSLFLALSNNSPKAQALAKRVVNHITKDYR